EPSSNQEPFLSPLQGLKNVILSPHIGGSTLEAQEAIAESVSTRLIRFMNNGDSDSAVNIPQVQLPRLHPEHHRVLHFHQNVPGVLGKMHSAAARLGVNIAAQQLQSDGQYAYAIMDVSAHESDALKEELAAIPETIRIRSLW
ncbi:MAG: phosphoglycerate dehydrogenase, partial [Myxococcota bacterium]|nr:phosphoglycerate dehydrogenase [Myxococcota bacterium]